MPDADDRGEIDRQRAKTEFLFLWWHCPPRPTIPPRRSRLLTVDWTWVRCRRILSGQTFVGASPMIRSAGPLLFREVATRFVTAPNCPLGSM
jgi:hypothetical protein